MPATVSASPFSLAQRRALRVFRLGLLSLAAAGAAHAQTPACEMLKSTLSARIPPAIRGFSMEALPAKAPVPPGGKVIGNCEGGAYKVVYSRFGGSAAAASSPTAEASPPVAASVATTPPPAPAPRPAPSTRATPAAAVPDPVPAPRPAPMEPTPARQPSQPAEPVHPSTVAAVTPITSDITSPPPTAEPPPGNASATAPEGPGFLATHWPWFAAALALPLLAALWAWLAHHRAYDAAGLPRGPKLN